MSLPDADFSHWLSDLYCAGSRIDLIWQLQALLPAVQNAHSLLRHFQLHWPSEAATLLDPLRELVVLTPSVLLLPLRLQDLRLAVDALRSTSRGRRLWGVAPARSSWSVAKTLFAVEQIELRRAWHFCELLLLEHPHLGRSLAVYMALLLETPIPQLPLVAAQAHDLLAPVTFCDVKRDDDKKDSPSAEGPNEFL